MPWVAAYRSDGNELARNEDGEFPLHSDDTGVGMECGIPERQQLI